MGAKKWPISHQIGKSTEKGWGYFDRALRGEGVNVPALLDMQLIDENLLYPFQLVSR